MEAIVRSKVLPDSYQLVIKGNPGSPGVSLWIYRFGEEAGSINVSREELEAALTKFASSAEPAPVETRKDNVEEMFSYHLNRGLVDRLYDACEAVVDGFSWGGTQEDRDYWNTVCNRLYEIAEMGEEFLEAREEKKRLEAEEMRRQIQEMTGSRFMFAGALAEEDA